MRIERAFTTAEQAPYEGIEFRTACSEIRNPDGSVVDNGGSNPVSGYGLFEAADDNDAVAKAKGCPVLDAGGSVELAEAFDM